MTEEKVLTEAERLEFLQEVIKNLDLNDEVEELKIMNSIIEEDTCYQCKKYPNCPTLQNVMLMVSLGAILGEKEEVNTMFDNIRNTDSSLANYLIALYDAIQFSAKKHTDDFFGNL